MTVFAGHMPALWAHVCAAFKADRSDVSLLRLDPTAWVDVEAMLIDYAVLVRSESPSVLPCAGK